MKNISFFIILFSIFCQSQNNYTSAQSIEKSEIQYKNQLENSIVKNIQFVNIGPSVMSGRVTDIEVNPKNTSEFYVAYASGGLWHTINNGTTFDPIMDNSITQNIGDFAVDWETKAIYVGTGESNSSRSSYPGIGIIKSTDNGKTWKNVGLRDSHHVSRILINPKDNQHIVVAVIGHLYSKNTERGIFNSFDGGKTWTKSLYIDDNTGAIDIVYDPSNFNIQYAAFWERERNAWNFKGSGSNSGIYKTIDGGKNWKKISTSDSGFPTGQGVGRIGLAIYDSSVIYAVLDNQFRRKVENKSEGLKRLDFKEMSKQSFMDLGNEKLNSFIKQNGFPKDTDAVYLKSKINSNQLIPEDIYKFLTDANAELFDTPVIGAEVYKSIDGGISWQKQNSNYLDGVYNSYGYYFGRIHVSPTNSDQIYIYGVPILKSDDSGKTFKRIGASNVHVDHHDLWINPKNTNHLVLGNDGGVNISYDQGDNWIKLNQPSVGQFYSINVDNSSPYNVYGGLQDNGVWMAKNNSIESPSWYESGHNNWTKIMGGDGMQIQIDKRNNNIVYTGLQFGNYYRLDLSNNDRKSIKPKHKLGDSPLRFNWQTPILISPHNQDIIYFGSNKLHRSFNKGDDWEEISDDLTTGGKRGNVPYGTITSFDESIFQFGKLVVGSDDGILSISVDTGKSWKSINKNLPPDLWVSRVIFSKHENNRIYLSLNGYRYNDFKPYIYLSDDNGDNWENISSNLPLSPVNVIREDINRKEILYAGTDNGLFISFNNGKKWYPFESTLNRVAVHDLVIQTEKNDLLVGTHGRSIYKTNLDLFNDFMIEKNEEKPLIIFEINDLKHSNSWGKKSNYSDDFFKPLVKAIVYSDNSIMYDYTLRDDMDNILNKGQLNFDKGFNYIEILPIINESLNKNKLKKIGLSSDKSKDGNIYLSKGDYKLNINGLSRKFSIK